MSFAPPVHVGIRRKSLFPAGAHKKPIIPEWGIFQNRCPTEQEKEKWKSHDGPWALACGPVSGVIVLDFDGSDGEALLQKLKDGGKHIETWTARTPSGGTHLFYQFPNGDTGLRIKNNVRILPGLDVRAKGGYVLVPSTYKDGRRWIHPPVGSPSQLPAWFLDVIKTSPERKSITTTQGLPAGVGKGERNNVAARLAGRYIKRGNTPEETFLLLKEWNRQNSPPLPDSELRLTVESISRADVSRVGTIEVIDSTDLMKMDIGEPEFLVSPFLPIAGKGILAAVGGTGKTLLGLNLAISLASELPLFGRFDVRKGRTLYIDAESTPSLTRHRISRVARGLGTTIGGVSLSFPQTSLDLSNHRIRDDLCREIDKRRASLLVLDSFLCFTNIKNENDNTEVRKFLERVGEIPKKTGTSIILIDHASKPSPEKVRGRLPVTIRGAGAKNDWADVTMIMSERMHNNKFLRSLTFSKTRFCAPLPTMVLEMSANFVFSATEENEICPMFTLRQVLADNPGIGWVDFCNKLTGQTGCSRTSAHYAIRQAVKAGIAEKKKSGRNTAYFIKETRVIQPELAPPQDEDEWDE